MKTSLLILLNLGLLIGIMFAWNDVSSDEYQSEDAPTKKDTILPDDEDALIEESTDIHWTPERKEEPLRENDSNDSLQKGSQLQPLKSNEPVRESQILKKIKSGKLIHQLKTETDSEGVYSKLSIYQTDLKHKNILVEEDFSALDESGSAIRSIAMAADHLLIQIDDGTSDANLSQALAELEIQLEPTETPGLYRASFDGSDPIKFHETQQALQEAPGLKFSEPDYVISLD